jgi:hypothetical protein
MTKVCLGTSAAIETPSIGSTPQTLSVGSLTTDQASCQTGNPDQGTASYPCPHRYLTDLMCARIVGAMVVFALAVVSEADKGRTARLEKQRHEQAAIGAAQEGERSWLPEARSAQNCSQGRPLAGRLILFQ